MIDVNTFLLTNTQKNIQKMYDEIRFVPTSAIDDPWGGIVLFFSIMGWITLMFLLFMMMPDLLMLWILLCVLFLPLCIWAFNTSNYKQNQLTMAMQLYSSEKIDLLRMYSSVVSDMNVDFVDQEINPEKIIDIEQGIRNLGSSIASIYILYRDMLRSKVNLYTFSDQTIRANYQNFLTQEWLWLTECIASFSRDLDTWMTRHHSELVQLKDSVNTQMKSTNMVEWKAALGLTEERISKLSEEIPICVK